ncbi:hypothetical protein CP98_01430 [Sphingobium yanoikuyae]|uniref:Uncharacterized protein n=1 Tax=Sphingobium yanoikuyae TaxID=13690 RepID=A0A084EQI3_SPHYA|nr:hypothetical protein CP98_01430 [Sphingobium yanoikuyae]
MTGYLQRLLDRGAALAAPSISLAPAEVTPAVANGSPLAQFDQRLATPGLAQDYQILGLTPEPLNDEQVLIVPPPMPQAHEGKPPVETIPPSPGTPARRGTPASPVSSLPITADALAHTDIAARAARPDVAKPILSPRAVLLPDPVVASAEPAPRQSRPVEATSPPLVTPPTLPERPSASQSLPSSLVRPSKPAHPAIPIPIAQAHASAVTTAQTDTIAPPSKPWARSEVSELVSAQPVLPPPLESLAPPESDARAIERIVRETMRSEFARARPAKGRVIDEAPYEAVTPPANEDRHDVPPQRMTAREASVIGELQSTRSPPLILFGLRLR